MIVSLSKMYMLLAMILHIYCIPYTLLLYSSAYARQLKLEITNSAII